MAAHKKKQKVDFASYAPLVIAAAVLSLVVIGFFHRPRSRTATPVVKNTTVSIVTSDGITLAGEIHYPAGHDRVPAVIVLHELGGDHHQWDPYINQLTSQGLAVMAYDLRGFGQSRIPRVAGDSQAYLNGLLNDVPAVIAYLHQQSRIDPAHISIVGAGLGANVAYVAAGLNLQIFRTVALSPSASAGVLDGATMEHFAPSGVFFIADEVNQGDIEQLLTKAVDPKRTEYISGGGTGLQLLQKPEVINHVLSWITP